MSHMGTITQEAAPRAASAAEQLVHLGRAADDAQRAYLAALMAAFGRGWAAWFANASQPNPHPHRPGLSDKRAAWVQATRDYRDAYRAYHLPRGEG